MPREKSFAYFADYSEFGIRPVNPRIGFTYHREVLKMSNLQHVKQIISESDYVSIDTETTSLEYAETVLVSINLSIRVGTEIESYVAFYHLGYVQRFFESKLDKLPSRLEILKIVQSMLHRKYCVMHNRPFDQGVLTLSIPFNKLTDCQTMAEELICNTPADFKLTRFDFINVYDTLALFFQMDSNCLSGLSLKDLAPTYLGINMTHFDEAVGLDILNSKPRNLLDYGALDTYATLSLFLLIKGPFQKRCPLLFKLQPQFTTALWDLEQQTHTVDLDQCLRLSEENRQEIESLKDEFYTNFGVINLGSSLQKSRLLMNLGYSTGVFNKPRPDGEQVMSTKSEILEKMIKKVGGCRPAELMIKYGELLKLQSSYYDALYKYAGPQEDGTFNPIRFHLHENRAPTLRLAAGKYTINKKAYKRFIPMNMMALPKPHTLNRGMDYDPHTFEFKFYDPKDTEAGQFYVETGGDKANFRSCFVPPKGYVIIKADYCLSLDTLIKTSEGEKPLRDLIGSEILVETPVGLKKAKNIRLTGKHKQYKFKLESGRTLVCSPEHRLAICREGTYMWEEASKIRLTDIILEYEQINKRINWDYQ